MIVARLYGETEKRARDEARKAGRSVSEWVGDVLTEFFKKLDDAAAAPPPPPVKETPKQRQNRFLETLERKFFVSRACRACDIPRSDVKKWLQKPDFAEAYAEAQACYIEWVESKLVRLGSVKGAVLALLSFLNAHNPHYGRQRVEWINRFLGPLMDQVYKLIDREIGGKSGEDLCRKIRQLVEKRLLDYSE